MFRSNPINSESIKKLDINGLYHKRLIDFNYFYLNEICYSISFNHNGVLS